MLKVIITDVKDVNKLISFEKITLLQKHCKELKDYLVVDDLRDVINHIREEFEEEVKIGTFFDINDYIEYFLERIREVY